ncbi:putative membrane protein (TIGR01666 family) [Orbus hercynius]|uniref:Putative membrane protein (TIGR01666 family) n=1 Tax=Orbus hercynius TaxID=593135 RepID=A0A495RK04_9GAMM|nr:YccS family putative transporter [Orbus hercynius]RKS87630.1 putative membrane protein (TIGR01666 family) [Orbus hercynius]
MNTLRLSLRQVFYHSNVLYCIRILISLTGTTFIPWYLGDITAVIPLTLGVVAAALTEIDTRLLNRFINLVITLICFSLATFSVQLLFPYPAIFIVGLVISTFVFTMLGALGQRYAVIAFGSLLIAAYTMLGHEMYQDLYSQSIYLLLGAIWYNVVVFIESFIQPIRTTQQSLAISFSKLGNYLDAKAALFDPDENNHFTSQLSQLAQANDQLIDALNQTKHSLFNRLKSYRGQSYIRNMLNEYFVAQDIHERANATHVGYETLSQQFKHSDILFRFARILNLQAKACYQLAISIKYNQVYQHNPAFEKYFGYLADAITRHQGDSKLINALNHLLKNLHSIDLLLSNINNEQQLSSQYTQRQLVDDKLGGFKDCWQRIKQNLTVKSTLFRHAVRMSLVFFVGYAIIQLTDLQHGYWIILTSLFVCQPNYSTTKFRLRLRVMGTIGGIIIGIPLTYLLPNIQAQLVLIILSGWLFFLFKNSQYAYATAFITLLVFFSFGLVGESSLTVATYRIIATIIGCFIAWCAVSFIWPDWKFRNLPTLICRACHDDCHYLAIIGAQYLSGKSNDASYRVIRRSVHENNADLSSLISIMAKEPHIDQAMIQQAFRFLTLNHTLISYISTLAVHRDKPIHPETLSLFDDACVIIINILDANQKMDKDLSHIRDIITHLVEKQSHDLDNNDCLVLQQLLLILDILPETAQLAEQLSKVRN